MAKTSAKSPLECSPIPPVRAIAKPARDAIRSHWSGISGASVATRTMIEPEPSPAAVGNGTRSAGIRS
ncbi:MAG: hypothetical protein WKF41_04505 [Gaiellaceae bacterium]